MKIKFTPKIIMIIWKSILILSIIMYTIYVIIFTVKIKKNIADEKINDEVNSKYLLKIDEENEIYCSYKEKFNAEKKEPYIPENFKYVCGDVDSGFVIEDENKNQFVWIPCDENFLKKNDIYVNAIVKCSYCYDYEYDKFFESVLKYHGFYVSRYEISVENGKAISQSNKNMCTNITQEEAIKLSNEMISNINTELLTGYAYDTMIDWITSKHKININLYENEEKITGCGDAYNNIYGIFDNNYELTQELYFDKVNSKELAIYRGFEKNELTAYDDSRLTIFKDLGTTFIGFRIMMYK